MKNFYEDKLKEIKEVMQVDKQKAYTLINEELKMPYIPEKYEVQFVKLADELAFELKGDPKAISLTREEIIAMLFSGDQIKEVAAIDSIREQNIRTYLADIEKWIFMNPENTIAQAVIYEMLVEQEIDKDIIFDELTLNPVKDGAIMENVEIKKAFEVVLGSSTTPQVQESAIKELKFYLLKSFPRKVNNGESLANNFIAIIESLLEGNNSFEGEQKNIYNIIKQK